MPIGLNVCEMPDMVNAARVKLRQIFLDTSGWGTAHQDALAGDASNRRYIRLNKEDEHAMLMDAPPPTEDVRPFTHIARHLLDQGFSAPRIFAEDPHQGFLIIEDFGDDTFTNLLADGADETALYTLAIDTLAHLHTQPVAADVPPYNDDRLLTETALLPEWFMTAHNISGDFERYTHIWRDLFQHVHTGPVTLVLRDYHVDNLMRLNDRNGISACGLLDFQDALMGHPAYDLMSLLEDARRDVPQDLQDLMIERYHTARNTQDRAAFDQAYAILAAQRHAKVIGIFTRLNTRDGKPHYLAHMDRLWRLFERSLEHPALAPMKAWVDEFIPDVHRRTAKDRS